MFPRVRQDMDLRREFIKALETLYPNHHCELLSLEDLTQLSKEHIQREQEQEQEQEQKQNRNQATASTMKENDKGDSDSDLDVDEVVATIEKRNQSLTESDSESDSEDTVSGAETSSTLWIVFQRLTEKLSLFKVFLDACVDCLQLYEQHGTVESMTQHFFIVLDLIQEQQVLGMEKEDLFLCFQKEMTQHHFSLCQGGKTSVLPFLSTYLKKEVEKRPYLIFSETVLQGSVSTKRKLASRRIPPMSGQGLGVFPSLLSSDQLTMVPPPTPLQMSTQQL